MATQEHEVAYDSGIPGGSVSLPYAPRRWAGGILEVNMQHEWIGNSMLAVRFTPDNSTVQMLLRVRFYITGDLESFNVWLFDSSRQFITYARAFGSDLGSQYVSDVYCWNVTPASIGWVDLNVMSAVNPIFVADDFYVAIEFTVDQKPSLGVDTAGPRSNRGWFVDNQSINGWVEYSTYAEQHGLPQGNLMIRAVIAPLTEVTTTTTAANSAPPGWKLPTATALAVLFLAVIGVWQVRKRRQVG